MAKKTAAKTVEKTEPAPAAIQPVEIKSVDDLDAALKEWGELNSKEATLTQAVKLKVNTLLTECQQKMVVDVDGKQVSIEARRSALDAGVRQYCVPNKAKLLEGLSTKSRNLTHGTIAWRGVPQKLVDTDAAKPESTASKFIATLVAIARKAIKKVELTLFPELMCTEVVSINVEWNRTLLFEKYKSGEITLAQLKTAGFDIEGGKEAEETFSAKPTEVLVKSEGGPQV